jgi:hypothetical protein
MVAPQRKVDTNHTLVVFSIVSIFSLKSLLKEKI